MRRREVSGRNRDDLKEWRIADDGTIHGHLNYMPVTYHGNGIYRSIIDGTEVRVKPLPKDIFK